MKLWILLSCSGTNPFIKIYKTGSPPIFSQKPTNQTMLFQHILLTLVSFSLPAAETASVYRRGTASEYAMGEFLGPGATGDVYKAIKISSGDVVAIKVPHDDKKYESFKYEKKTLEV
jgi:hypothetical protein